MSSITNRDAGTEKREPPKTGHPSWLGLDLNLTSLDLVTLNQNMKAIFSPNPKISSFSTPRQSFKCQHSTRAARAARGARAARVKPRTKSG